MSILSILSTPSSTVSRAASDDQPSLVDGSFEQRLIEGIRPIADHFLAFALHHLFDTGLHDELARRPAATTIGALADSRGMEEHRLRGFLLYLANEGVVQVEGESVRLTPKGVQYGEFKPWYTMLIGGYSSTVGQIGAALSRGAADCTRDGRYVGLGSCEISRYDGMPMTRQLLANAGVDSREVLDLGCGNALYLVEFCRAMPGMVAWGVEPDSGGHDEAQRLVSAAGMSDRVRLANRSATDFLRNPPADCNPDLIVFGYVLQEILAQEGEDAILALLRDVVDRFPKINIVVIEVANEIDNPAVMRHGLATNFWNPYYLIHYFTRQRLERKPYWDDLFSRAGLQTVSFVSTDPRVDSTGVELGYLLRGPAFH
jgi:2-ketoarginine methyltransferase